MCAGRCWQQRRAQSRCVCVCACVCVRLHACVRVCVCMRVLDVHACARECKHTWQQLASSLIAGVLSLLSFLFISPLHFSEEVSSFLLFISPHFNQGHPPSLTAPTFKKTCCTAPACRPAPRSNLLKQHSTANSCVAPRPHAGQRHALVATSSSSTQLFLCCTVPARRPAPRSCARMHCSGRRGTSWRPPSRR